MWDGPSGEEDPSGRHASVGLTSAEGIGSAGEGLNSGRSRNRSLFVSLGTNSATSELCDLG